MSITMDYYNHLYDLFKGKTTQRADYWRCYQPYCFLLDEDNKKAYPVNRFYKQLTQPKGAGFISYPPHTTKIWVYTDDRRPFDSKINCAAFARAVIDIYNYYEVVHHW